MSTPARPRRRWLRIVLCVFEVGTLLVALPALFLWCSIPDTARLATENPTSTAFIDLRRDEAASAGKTLALEWQWRSLGKISRYLRAAVIYAEDWRFYEHDGVDWVAIEKAIDSNLEKGSLAIGASTITQQLAKNLYLSPSRSFTRKLREMLIAFSLEDDLSKQRILELYLNVAEWGDGVFGAEAAAQHWFKHSAQSLTPAEAVRLACALPNPYTKSPDKTHPELKKKSVRLVHMLRVQGLLDENQERTALDAVGARDVPVLRKRGAPEESKPDLAEPVAKDPPTAADSATSPESTPPASGSSESSSDPLPPESTPQEPGPVLQPEL